MTCASKFAALALPLAALGPWTNALPADPPVETVPVLVARTELSPGTVIRDPRELFKKVHYRKGDEPRDAVARFKHLEGKTVARRLGEDQPVKARDLAVTGKPPNGGLPEGMRAVAIRTTQAEVAGGFILPGSRIDVLLQPKHGGTEGKAAPVAENLLVMAVDQAAEKPSDGTGRGLATVTVAVPLDQAFAIAGAGEKGKLRLMLRPFGGDEAPPWPKGRNPK